MNTEKKLEYFTDAITKEVESKKRQARRQMTTEFNTQVSAGVAQAKTEAEARIAAEKQELDKSVNKRLTEAITEGRRALSALREELTAQLFDDIKADVIAFTHTPEYEGFLIDGLQAILGKTKQPYKYIQLNPKDMGLSDKIQNATGLTPEPTETDILGGFRLLSANRDKAADYTFVSSLDEAMQAFYSHIGAVQST